MVPGDGGVRDGDDDDGQNGGGMSTFWIVVVILAINAAGIGLYCFYK